MVLGHPCGLPEAVVGVALAVAAAHGRGQDQLADFRVHPAAHASHVEDPAPPRLGIAEQALGAAQASVATTHLPLLPGRGPAFSGMVERDPRRPSQAIVVVRGAVAAADRNELPAAGGGRDLADAGDVRNVAGARLRHAMEIRLAHVLGLGEPATPFALADLDGRTGPFSTFAHPGHGAQAVVGVGLAIAAAHGRELLGRDLGLAPADALRAAAAAPGRQIAELVLATGGSGLTPTSPRLVVLAMIADAIDDLPMAAGSSHAPIDRAAATKMSAPGTRVVCISGLHVSAPVSPETGDISKERSRATIPPRAPASPGCPSLITKNRRRSRSGS